MLRPIDWPPSGQLPGAVAAARMLAPGDWAALAHLGFAPAPAPLHRLTLAAAMLLLATFTICGVRVLAPR